MIQDEKLNTTYAAKIDSLVPSAMDVANFSFTVLTTSALIALVHSPINTLLVNYIKTEKFLVADTHTSMNRLILLRQFYIGFASCFAGVGTRTTYMSGAKKVEPYIKSSVTELEEQNKEVPEGQFPNIKKLALSMATLSLVSLGELAMTQIPEVVSSLRKANAIDEHFKWYESRHFMPLSTAAAGARYAFSYVNFFSLCEIEPRLAESLPLSNETARHFASGMLSGMTAAFISYPFAHYRDYYLSRVSFNGTRLMSPGFMTLWRNYQLYAKEVGFYTLLKTTLVDFSYTAPLRALRAGTRFSLIAGVSSFFGDKPCQELAAKISFFSSKSFSNDSDNPNPPCLK